jgi:hypothetical protein
MPNYPKRTFNDIKNITNMGEVMSLNFQEFWEFETQLERLAYNNPSQLFRTETHSINEKLIDARDYDSEYAAMTELVKQKIFNALRKPICRVN